MAMNTVFLSLGSNEGDRESLLGRALSLLGGHCGELQQVSSFYETAAWGLENQPDFLNIAACLYTKLTAGSVLKEIERTEKELGRQRTIKWGPRTIDIDILFFNSEIYDTDDLEIPHPRLQDRRFVLAPMAEIAPDFVHPSLGKTMKTLLQVCSETPAVRLLKPWNWPHQS